MVGRLRSSALWLLLLASAASSTARAGEFTSFKQKIRYLTYLRRTQPALYNAFVISYEPVQFLDRMQEAIDSVPPAQEFVPGRHVRTIKRAEEAAFEFRWEPFRDELERFESEYDHTELPLMEAIQREATLAKRLDGFHAYLARSPIFGDTSLLRKPQEQRLEVLSERLATSSIVHGFSPRRVGIAQNHLTGHEFVERYTESVRAQSDLNCLVWLFLVAQIKGLEKKTVQDLTQYILARSDSDLQNLLTSVQFNDAATKALARSSMITKPDTTMQHSFDRFSELTGAQRTAKSQTVLTVATEHPYGTPPRGELAGDCASFNSAAVPFARGEEVLWITPRSGLGHARGYIQFTHLETENSGAREKAWYLHTISGAGITRMDTLYAVFAMFRAMNAAGVQHLILPEPARLNGLINYPEIAEVLYALASKGRSTPLFYTDANDRKNLAKFTFGSLDSPEANISGREIRIEDLELGGLDVEVTDTAIPTTSLFPEPSREEAMMIALDLRNRNTDIAPIFPAYDIDLEAFNRFWELTQNTDQRTIADFHYDLQEQVKRFGLPVTWSDLKRSTLLFRGHLAAVDGLDEGPGLDLALSYIETFLSSFSDLAYVYDTIGAHLSVLETKPRFVKIVKTLFRRQVKEMRRRLDFYELEHRSAYHTLLKLFKLGLSPQLFANELEQLEVPPEDVQSGNMTDYTFVRRVTFLGFARGYHVTQFEQLLDFLEHLEQTGIDPAADDVEIAAYFLAKTAATEHVTPAHITRLERFLTQTNLGLRFIMYVGRQTPPKLDVGKLIDTLFAKGKYQWAGRMIYMEPFPSYPQASRWIGELWKHRDHIPDELFLEALVKTPSWQMVAGIPEITDELLKTARDTVANETHMLRLLIAHPPRLTAARIAWLAELSSLDLAQLAIDSIDATWTRELALDLSARLSKRFEQLDTSGVAARLKPGDSSSECGRRLEKP